MRNSKLVEDVGIAPRQIHNHKLSLGKTTEHIKHHMTASDHFVRAIAGDIKLPQGRANRAVDVLAKLRTEGHCDKTPPPYYCGRILEVVARMHNITSFMGSLKTILTGPPAGFGNQCVAPRRRLRCD